MSIFYYVRYDDTFKVGFVINFNLFYLNLMASIRIGFQQYKFDVIEK